MKDRILVVDDEESIRWVLGTSLEKCGYEVEFGENGTEAIEKATSGNYSLILLDINMPDLSGFEVLTQIREKVIDCPIILITAQNTVSNAIESIQMGAYDYVAKPFDLDEVQSLVKKAIESYKNTKKLKKRNGDELPESISLDEIVGSSSEMLDIYKIIGRVANKDITVLITGESGTGKELITKSIHTNSLRKNSKIVSVNISAIPKELIESELFGHEKGAFTGAVAAKKGRFEEASGGTLHLDEIGELSFDLQSKLLRVLEEKKIYRLGSENPVDVNVRIVASTNRDLGTEVKNGNFREDLYYRLNAITINLPPLRKRKDDIKTLITHFTNKYCRELSLDNKYFSEEAEKTLVDHSWPGNVRELENVIKRVLVLSPDKIISKGMLVGELKFNQTDRDKQGLNKVDQTIKDQINLLLGEMNEDSKDVYSRIINRFEKHLIEILLDRANGNKKKAAEILGINRNTLSKKIKELEIETD